eukprot:TRINITY_DN23373_c0_g1_i4.p1 TRINITY_DN23373_c0_g1~~TRINITY_DN23373_c0_g1_i4.p1  ORF type:complete len:822 (-),score=149.16 TRINITY_DN23373_c0_g1_i4:31-2496(-)
MAAAWPGSSKGLAQVPGTFAWSPCAVRPQVFAAPGAVMTAPLCCSSSASQLSLGPSSACGTSHARVLSSSRVRAATLSGPTGRPESRPLVVPPRASSTVRSSQAPAAAAAPAPGILLRMSSMGTLESRGPGGACCVGGSSLVCTGPVRQFSDPSGGSAVEGSMSKPSTPRQALPGSTSPIVPPVVMGAAARPAGSASVPTAPGKLGVSECWQPINGASSPSKPYPQAGRTLSVAPSALQMTPSPAGDTSHSAAGGKALGDCAMSSPPTQAQLQNGSSMPTADDCASTGDSMASTSELPAASGCLQEAPPRQSSAATAQCPESSGACCQVPPLLRRPSSCFQGPEGTSAGPLPPPPSNSSVPPTRLISGASCASSVLASESTEKTDKERLPSPCRPSSANSTRPLCRSSSSASETSCPTSAAKPRDETKHCAGSIVNGDAPGSSITASHTSSVSRTTSQPRSPRRFDDLYVDAFARRERQQERAASVARLQQDVGELENLALLRIKERQASYRGRQDPRSHSEREQDLLKRRMSWSQTFQTQQALREQQEMRECTFRPETGSSKASSSRSSAKGMTRSLSRSHVTGSNTNGAMADGRGRRTPPNSSRRPSAAPSPRDSDEDLWKLQEKQISVLRQLGEICASMSPETSAGQSGSGSCRGAGVPEGCDSPRDHLGRRPLGAPGGFVALAAEGPEKLANELRLYRQQLTQVHALERLDMQALELPHERLKILLSTGFKLGLAEGLRRKLRRPPASSVAKHGSAGSVMTASASAIGAGMPSAAQGSAHDVEFSEEGMRLMSSSSWDATLDVAALDDELLSASSPA